MRVPTPSVGERAQRIGAQATVVVEVVGDKPFERRMMEVQALDVRALDLAGFDVGQAEDAGRVHAGATDVRANDTARPVELVDQLL